MIELDRFEISNIVQDNSVFSVYVDVKAKELHVLDLNEPNRSTVASNAGREFFKKLNKFLADELGNDYGVEWFTNFIYGADGGTTHFDVIEQHFKGVYPFRALYPPFEKVLRERNAEGIFRRALCDHKKTVQIKSPITTGYISRCKDCGAEV